MPEDLSFEAAFEQLNEKVQALERGGLSLEEATRLFKEGMVLARRCDELLTRAGLKVEQLKEVYADYSADAAPPGEE